MTGQEILVLIVVLVLFFAFLGGMIQTFQRNWIAALLLLIFLSPLWLCWAIVEMFLPKPGKKVIYVEVNTPQK